MEGLKEDMSSLIDYAHRTKSVAECYKPVRELIDEDTLKEYLPGCWITLIKVCSSSPHPQPHPHRFTGLHSFSLASSPGSTQLFNVGR